MFLALRFCHLIISLTAYLTNDLEEDLESLKLYLKCFFCQNPMKKRYYYTRF